MDDRSELHWRYLKDNLDHSRHHETLRATSSNILLAVAGAGFAVVGYDKAVAVTDLPVLLFVFALGLFGALFAAKQTERASLHYQRARALRDALDQGPHAPDFRRLKGLADAKHEPKYPWLSARDLRSFWVALHLGVSALAVVLVAVGLAGTRADEAVDAGALLGTWKVDLRPTPDAPPYFQEFVVTRVLDGKSFEGTYYGTPVTQARINTDWGAVRIAFVTADGSGPYNHSAVLRDGRLEGLTNATGRDFLAYWSAVKP